MTEHEDGTPSEVTTEVVRSFYAQSADPSAPDGYTEEPVLLAAFDRWLAEHDRALWDQGWEARELAERYATHGGIEALRDHLRSLLPQQNGAVR